MYLLLNVLLVSRWKCKDTCILTIILYNYNWILTDMILILVYEYTLMSILTFKHLNLKSVQIYSTLKCNNMSKMSFETPKSVYKDIISGLHAVECLSRCSFLCSYSNWQTLVDSNVVEVPNLSSYKNTKWISDIFIVFIT